MPRQPDHLERQLDAWAASQRANASPEAQKAIQQTLAASLQPVRQLPSTGRLVVAFVAVLCLCALALAAAMKEAGVHLTLDMPAAWMTAVLLGAAILLSVTLAWQMVPGSRQRFPFWLAMTLSGLGVVAGMAWMFPWRATRNFGSEGWPCALMEVTIAVPATIIFWLLARRGVLFSSGPLGAAIGGLAVLLAMTAVEFQCMFLQAPHLLVWHAGTAAIFIALGSLIGAALGRR